MSPAERQLLAQHLSPQTIMLWGGEEIEPALRAGSLAEGFMIKYRMAVERGIADFNLGMRGIR